MHGLSSIVAALVFLVLFIVVTSIAVILINLFKSYNYSSSTILNTGLSALNCINDSSMIQLSVNNVNVSLSKRCMVITLNGTKYIVYPALGSPG